MTCTTSDKTNSITSIGGLDIKSTASNGTEDDEDRTTLLRAPLVFTCLLVRAGLQQFRRRVLARESTVMWMIDGDGNHWREHRQ
ncbi:hypothetical protein V6N11_010210 [Hibiscus sabdariffa]|uniref:Uncharacterized protein n=1 Tax=Hibiscus sabdariffa TaxID=183260 RepID=A0ABR2PEB7_9ROSI